MGDDMDAHSLFEKAARDQMGALCIEVAKLRALVAAQAAEIAQLKSDTAKERGP